MNELYDGFVGTSVSEVSLTEQMMKTVKAAVLAGCAFGEEAFPIIRSLMYMDGMVLKGHPHVDLISSMGPYLDEFSVLIDPHDIIKPTLRMLFFEKFLGRKPPFICCVFHLASCQAAHRQK